jgi:putative transposase
MATPGVTTSGVFPTRKRKPPRLERVFQKYDPTLYFVTFNTHLRRAILASEAVHGFFVEYAERAPAHDIGVGRYVIMPDHVHLFVCFGIGSTLTLGEWIKGLKRRLDVALLRNGSKPSSIGSQKLRSFWQPGFHDHVLRTDESYGEKWHYVRENPVRAGLVLNADDWPYAGEIVIIDRI